MRKKVNKKLIVALLSFVLLFGGTFGSSLAWLFAESTDVQNTFSTSDITVNLAETIPEDKSVKMIPGDVQGKNPAASVTNTSEDCYLFVKVEESATLKGYIKYAIDEQWEPLLEDASNNVYYMVFNSEDTAEEKPVKGQGYNILGGGTYTFTNGTESDDDDITYTWNDNQVLTLPEVDKDDMEAVNNGTATPTLSFKAYAVQLWKMNPDADDPTTDENEAMFTPAEAWKLAETLD